METISIIVNGDKKAEIFCKPEDKQTITSIFSKLGIYSSFHGYNFQFFSNF